MTPRRTIGAGITVHAGLSGAGKTHGIREDLWTLVGSGCKAIVLDRVREWDAVPPALAKVTRGTSTVERACQAFDEGARLVIVRPSLANVDRETEAACEWACSTRELTGIALPEAHRAIPKKFASNDTDRQWLQTVITEWRHNNVAIWCDTQRFALLNTDVVELARRVRLFAMCGKNDLKAASDVGGRELVEAIKECADRLDAGEPGWHVALGARRAPPYTLTREGAGA